MCACMYIHSYILNIFVHACVINVIGLSYYVRIHICMYVHTRPQCLSSYPSYVMDFRGDSMNIYHNIN